MKPRVLFTVTSDPRTSPRPAEAVRIAAGVGSWQKIEVTLYLRGAAVLLLGEWAEELVDGDNFARYLPLVAEAGQPICVQGGPPALSELAQSRVLSQAIGDAHLAQLAARSHYLTRF